MKIPSPKEDCLECGTRFKPEYQEQKFCSTDCEDNYDPTPCCWAHGQGALSTREPCPKIADND